MDNLRMDDFNSPDELLELERLVESFDPEMASEFEEVEVTEKDSEIIEMFQRNHASAQEAWAEPFKYMAEDWDIYTLNQWSSRSKVLRGLRPKVTIDVSRKFVKATVGECYRNPPSINLIARSASATKKSKAISEAVRYIEDRTGAKYAYTWAKECAAVAGLGWIKVTYRYDEQQDMPAVIDIDRVDDPLSILIDPDSRQISGEDAMYLIECHGKTNDKEQFTYWWKDDELNVKWALISGNKVKDKGVWPDAIIPIVPVYGEFTNIRNNRKCFGIIRQIKDIQHSINYTISEGIERLALTPRNPLVYAKGSLTPKQRRVAEDSASDPRASIEYEPFDKSGRPLPAPSRQDTAPDIAWLPQVIQQYLEMAKETTGIYDTALGQNGNEISGVAIAQKTNNGDRGQLVYDEHLQIAVKQVGHIVVGLFPSVIEPSNVLPLLSEDGESDTLLIGTEPIPATDPNTGMPIIDPNTGMQMMIEPDLPDLDPSDLEISIRTGKAYGTRKEEGLEMMGQLIPSLPPEQQSAVIPRYIEDLGFPGSEAYAEILNPQSDTDNPAALQQQVAQLNQQLQQINQANQQLQSANQQLTMELNRNTQVMIAKAQIDSETKKAVEMMKQQGETQRKVMDINADSQNTQLDLMNDEADRQHETQLAGAEMGNANMQQMMNIDAESEADNKQIMLQSEKMRQDMIDKIEVQPMAVIDRTGL